MEAKKVVFYPGCTVNYFDQETGTDIVKIMRNNNIEVVVPKFVCCSMTLFYSGDIDYARLRAAELVKILSPLVEQGYEIIVSCPSCLYALKEVYPFLLGSSQAQNVAEKTRLFSQYLLDLHKKKELKADFRAKPLLIAYHAPCHLKTQNLPTVSAQLMQLVPETSVITLDRGCCGMGGTWGMHSKHQNKVSAHVGSDLFKAVEETNPQLIATDCFGCQIQIASHTNKRVIHPVKFIAEALNLPHKSAKE